MHSHIDEFGYIHMKGRVYDPATMLFLSPDPYIQTPGDWLNFNRYSYCLNNPFKYTDPSGNMFSAVTGFLRGLFSKEPWKAYDSAWRSIQNEYKIYWGLLKTDSNLNFADRAKQLISRFTWESLQTTVGFTYSHATNMLGFTRRVTYYGGATVSESYSSKYVSNGAISIGAYIVGKPGIKADPNNTLFQHEYGHYLQSQSMGPSYLFRVGFRSIQSAGSSDGSHKYNKYEQDANVRGFLYFNRYVDGFYQSQEDFNNNYDGSHEIERKGWNFYKNPLAINGTNNVNGKYWDYKDRSIPFGNLLMNNTWFERRFAPFGQYNDLYLFPHKP
ncbi:hypothetical protein D0T53_01950 [Dysgonomonas sp. 216]|uniref:RHS repeat-associated core domain-containing protein n=1 Tax=Dysgonomonas sp. 216 TaxID=2302934 RepID=UPI0013CFAB91|nr:RHS repeat-associated core domain-containing protein [Dysgonomonas sp. 216]NDW17678.1 hypothetical protein [Dysgonomonas sp. 216]